MVKQERYFPGHDPAQLPDFEPLVTQARLGNQEAFRELDDYLRPGLHRYFSSRFREEADDLTQDTMIRITTGIATFKAKGEEGTYSQRFVWWCLTTAKNRLIDEFKIQARQRELVHMPDHHALEEFVSGITLHSSNNDSQVELNAEEENNALMARLKENLGEILSPAQREIVNQTLEGKNIQEIAAQRGCKEKSVISILSLARVKIEDTLLSPAGYIRAFRLGDDIQTAAHRRKVSGAVQFLGMWYITQEDVNRYQQTKQVVDQELINQGYVLLSRSASMAEAIAMKKYNQDALVFRRGMFYVKPESIDAFRQRKKKSGTTIINPPEGYCALTAFTQTEMERKKLGKAARKGKLKVIKQGRYWFTTQEWVNEFRQGNQRTLPRKGVIFPVKQ